MLFDVLSDVSGFSADEALLDRLFGGLLDAAG